MAGVATRLGTAAKTAVGRAATAAKTGASGFLHLSLGKQILVVAAVIVVVGGIAYLVWKRYQDDD